jgi:hypothetical protein
MSPAYVHGAHPVTDDGKVPGGFDPSPVAGRQYTVRTFDAFDNATAYTAIRWFDSRGVEWLDDPSPLARETLENHLDD